MMPGLGAPGGLGGMMSGPLPGASPLGGGGKGDDSFATGMLAGLGLREMSQLLGASRGGKKAAGAEMPAADQLGGQLGDIDKLVILSRLLGQQGGGPSPSGPPAPMTPPGSPLGGSPPALAALMASRGPGASPLGPPPGPGGPPMGPPMGAGAGPMPGGPMGAPAGPPIAGGGVSMVQMLMGQLLNKANGMV